MSEVDTAIMAELQKIDEDKRLEMLCGIIKIMVQVPTPPVPALAPVASPSRPRQQHNSKAVILTAPEVCQRLKISQRTLYRRLATDWADGHWFFKIHDKWHIRESHLEELIGLMEIGEIKL